MNKYNVIDEKTVYSRISKRQAKILVGNGHTIAICACKRRPGFPFSPCSAQCTIDSIKLDREACTFEKWLKYFVWYNCNYETGYYPAFYTLTERVSMPINHNL